MVTASKGTKVEPKGFVPTVDELINALPRTGRKFPNAIVWLDAAGNLNIEIVCGGSLMLEQDALGLLQVNEEELDSED